MSQNPGEQSNNRPNNVVAISSQASDNTSGNQPPSARDAVVGRTSSNQHVLQDLLNFSTRMSVENPSESSEPMSEEKKEFLSKALDSMCVDLVPMMKKKVDVLKEIHTKPEDLIEANLSKYEDTLNELYDFLYDIDLAKAFYQIDGLTVIAPLLRSKHPSLRKHAAALIVECCKNNPFCQQLSVTDELYSSLMEMATSDSNKEAMFNAIAAVSAITRSNPDGISQFNKYNGIQMLEKALNSGNEKIVNKTIFLVMALCDTDEKLKINLTESGVVINLITLLRLSDYIVKEYILRALLSVVKDNKTAQQMCCQHDLETYLNSLCKNSTEPEYQDLVECATSLLKELK